MFLPPPPRPLPPAPRGADAAPEHIRTSSGAEGKTCAIEILGSLQVVTSVKTTTFRLSLCVCVCGSRSPVLFCHLFGQDEGHMAHLPP